MRVPSRGALSAAPLCTKVALGAVSIGLGIYGALEAESPTIRDTGGFGVCLGVAAVTSALSSLLLTPPSVDVRWRIYARTYGIAP